MNVDIELLMALESTWATTASELTALCADNGIEGARGNGLPGSLTEASLRTEVVVDAFGVAATHFEALAALTRGSHNDYVVAESLFVSLLAGAGPR